MTDAQIERVLEGLRYIFTSPNEADSNLETANIVDGLYRLARAIDRLAVSNTSEVSEAGEVEALGKVLSESIDRLAAHTT